ncbi:hypothetical protein CEUSTIGMA_g149.t1 [Chlamydomonas eustigma]|uniref:EF-hand domain-containing protein n=1 Tax=Chlamydomonas eustigma TaxID=1157962 RepID=A0A250WPE5_9CHLO|nr:hypothetical protein CEUSTIGMA_g149.t1 [Chlamydomonas eustigma]|eukprot:GAX72693.1 hypothetical protein CEUSTIGMA_g149.t1 [Chlamydomonas eustigma]
MLCRTTAWNSYLQSRACKFSCKQIHWERVSSHFETRQNCKASDCVRLQAASASSEWNDSALSSAGLQSFASLANAWASLSSRLGTSFDSKEGLESLIITALKLLLSALRPGSREERADGREPLRRAVELGVTLAELSTAGIPLDADAIAAGIVLEAVESGDLDVSSIESRLGTGVATIVHDVLRIRTAPERVELFDDVASSAIREWCLAFHDVRANVLEIVCRWDDLQHMSSLPYSEQQILALEALQLFAPLGHALGLGAISSRIEDLSFQVLFPSSYSQTSGWLHDVIDVAEDALFECQRQLLAALDENERFKQLAASCVIRARTKSLFSIMKKMLRLEDLSRGGRQREEIYDVLGMRVIVLPRPELPIAESEAMASEACHVVRAVAESLWQIVPGRSKDYILHPKPNGYQSIHLTFLLQRPFTQSTVDKLTFVHDVEEGEDSVNTSEAIQPHMELQIRTQLMDQLAEAGEASHAAYKGGLDSRQAKQLREWTHQLRRQLVSHNEDRLLLPEAVTESGGAGGDKSGLRLNSKKGWLVEDAVGVAAKSLFSNWDADGNGVLSVEEVQEQLQELGAGPHVAAADAEALMFFLSEEEHYSSGRRGDSGDGDGSTDSPKGITLEEFARFVKKVSVVGALEHLDKKQMQDLSNSNPLPS